MPFLHCVTACTSPYVEPSPYLACSIYLPRASCTNGSAYGTAFQGFNITDIYSNTELNAALLAANTSTTTTVLNIAPGTYTLTGAYSPKSDFCMAVSLT